MFSITGDHLVTTSKELRDILIAAACVVDIDCHSAADGTSFITTAKEVVDEAAVNVEADATIAYVGLCILHFTVAAAEHPVEAAALDIGDHAYRSRCVAAAEHAADGVFAAEHVDCGFLG